MHGQNHIKFESSCLMGQFLGLKKKTGFLRSLLGLKILDRQKNSNIRNRPKVDNIVEDLKGLQKKKLVSLPERNVHDSATKIVYPIPSQGTTGHWKT